MVRRGFLFLLALAGLIMLARFDVNVTAQSRDRVSEEFKQVYPIASDGRVSLKNINGSVRVTAWDRNEVGVEATKWAYNPERLAEVKIQIDATGNAIRISTEYPQRTLTWNHGDSEDRYNNPASVEFTLSVPRAARIDKIELINGDLNIEGLTGEVRASSINGEVTGKRLTGEVKLSTINGRLGFELDSAAQSRQVDLSSVNGAVNLTLASDTEAEITAKTVHGGISNDLGLPVKRGKYVGRSLGGLLGRGGSQIELSNVNGSIRIERANDGRPQTTVTNTVNIDRDNDGDEFDKDTDIDDDIDIDVDIDIDIDIDDDFDMDIAREAARASREKERELREAEREMQRAARETERELRDAQREGERAMREAEHTMREAQRHIQRSLRRQGRN